MHHIGWIRPSHHQHDFFSATRWYPSSESLTWGSHNSNFTMVYGRYIELLTMVYKPTNIPGGLHPCKGHGFSFKTIIPVTSPREVVISHPKYIPHHIIFQLFLPLMLHKSPFCLQNGAPSNYVCWVYSPI